jgi:anti-sigma factor RsiW
MSSNPYHNNSFINRSNYEEYFLLYVDDELTAEEKAAVDQFLLLNPDLHQELEILLQTKLPPDLIPMEEKESLFSGSMKTKVLDETLLLYLDNELNEEEKRKVEENLESDAAYRLQYELLLKTKSDSSEVKVCPFKEELYRREERRIPVLWWRVAAVVLVVLSMGVLIVTSLQQPETVANNQSRQQSQPATIKKDVKGTEPVDQPVKDIAVENAETPSEISKEKEDPITAVQRKEERKIGKKTVTIPVQPDPVEEETVVVNMRPRPKDAPVLIPEKIEEPAVKEPLTKKPVTTDPLYTYNNTNALVNTVPAGADETEKNKSSLKGLLRKATRYVERRTNINVTNEDEELVIGAVAISLK